jgi:hypothetical protein
LTKVSAAATALPLSRATATVAGDPTLVLASVSVTPSSASDTVLVGLVTATPLMVSAALRAAAVCTRFCVAAGSWPRRLFSAASPATVIFRALAAPVRSDDSTSRNGEAPPSLTMLAVTPMPAALIESRMPASEPEPGSMVTVRTPLPAVAKAAPVYLPVRESKAPPLMVPKSKVIVPDPMVAVVVACPAATRRWFCASALTSTE